MQRSEQSGSRQTQESNSCIPWGAEQPIPRCCCLPRCLGCSLSPLHGLAKLEEATEVLAHGIGRDQLSETPIKAASGCHRRKDAAVGMEQASEGLRTNRDMVNILTAHFQHRRGAGSYRGHHQGCRQHCSTALGDSGDGNTLVQTPLAGNRDAATSLADAEQCL